MQVVLFTILLAPVGGIHQHPSKPGLLNVFDPLRHYNICETLARVEVDLNKKISGILRHIACSYSLWFFTW